MGFFGAPSRTALFSFSQEGAVFLSIQQIAVQSLVDKNACAPILYAVVCDMDTIPGEPQSLPDTQRAAHQQIHNQGEDGIVTMR